MEPTFILSAIQALMSSMGTGGSDCRCQCGGCCCDQLRDHSQQLAQYLAGLGGTFSDTGTDYSAARMGR